MVTYFHIDMTKILILRQETYFSSWWQRLKSMIFGSSDLGPCGEEKQHSGRSMWSVCSSRDRQEARRGNTRRGQDTRTHPANWGPHIVSPSMDEQTFGQACGKTFHISAIPAHSSNGSSGQTWSFYAGTLLCSRKTDGWCLGRLMAPCKANWIWVWKFQQSNRLAF